MLGTERHESRRIDNQLRGRSGRQGDPGESRFYLSLGDDLMVRFNGERVAAMMNLLRLPEDVPIEAKMVSKAIQSAQTQMEQQNFEIRKNVLKYDEVMNKQRTVIYDERREVLDGADLSDQIRPMIDEVVTGYVEGATASGYPEEWDLEQLWTALKTLYPISLTIDEAIEQAGGEQVRPHPRVPASRSSSPTRRPPTTSARRSSAPEVLRELERRVLLSVLDRKWREHLYEMDYLQEGIGLRAMAQRDPLVEYQREGFDMFAAMMDGDQGGVGRLPVQPRGAGRATEDAAPAGVGRRRRTVEARGDADEAAPTGRSWTSRCSPRRRRSTSRPPSPRRTARTADQGEGPGPARGEAAAHLQRARARARTRRRCTSDGAASRPAAAEVGHRTPAAGRAATRTGAAAATSAAGTASASADRAPHPSCRRVQRQRPCRASRRIAIARTRVPVCDGRAQTRRRRRRARWRAPMRTLARCSQCGSPAWRRALEVGAEAAVHRRAEQRGELAAAGGGRPPLSIRPTSSRRPHGAGSGSAVGRVAGSAATARPGRGRARTAAAGRAARRRTRAGQLVVEGRLPARRRPDDDARGRRGAVGRGRTCCGHERILRTWAAAPAAPGRA